MRATRSPHHVVLCAIVCIAVAGCQKKATDLADLQHQAAAIQAEYQPKLDALVARVRILKRDVRGNLPGWEPNIRISQLANDKLGLEPFEQTVPPGPEWRPNPPSLLGMGPYAQKRAAELASQNKVDELRFLVEDERKRYDKGIAEVDDLLKQVENWLAAARAGSGGSAQP